MRVRKYNLIINISTLDYSIIEWPVGGKALSFLFDNQSLVPMKVSNLEEVTSRNGVKISSLHECEAFWATKMLSRWNGVQREGVADFFWNRTKATKSNGMITFPSKNLRGGDVSGGFFFEALFDSKVQYFDLFKFWCEICSPLHGMLHPFLDKEMSSIEFRNANRSEIETSAWSGFLLGELYTEFRAGEMNSLVKGFTNLGWANYFRNEFLLKANIDDIRSMGFPCYSDGKGVIITLTERIDELTDRFDLFCERRMQLKELLGIDMFLIKD